MSTTQPNQILIVDDNPTNIKVLFDCLKSQGHRVFIAQSGESALEKLEVVTPDLILLDVMMPGIDGFETCRRLKSTQSTQNIPVIFMTALSETEHKVKGFSLGAVDYITKPFQQEEVLARVNVHLQLCNLNQELRTVNEQLENRVAERTARLMYTLEQMQNMQIQLIQSEKMSALGNLVAGVAHEINNPISFVTGNISPAKQYLHDLLKLIALYQAEYPEPSAVIQKTIKSIDLEYIKQDFPELLNSMEIGVERIFDISHSLRSFSRTDTLQKHAFDIHEGLDSTLLILKHRLKANEHRPDIKVIKNYGDLPPIECLQSHLNQVFMNILANAIDALEESNIGRTFDEINSSPNTITVTTNISQDEQYAVIAIKDNGTGIPQHVKAQMFDYLYTTKVSGKGTGLGLAICHKIVVEEHHGKIDVNSQPGEWSEFVITIPIQANIKNREYLAPDRECCLVGASYLSHK
ncbi:hybrid sensor histidine kinase/response regulator [Aetokthonos hydrillicola Thurmond2011]|jgi:signal transduction histidine kinase|uniref:histidine kinase n=1 Tax=Aetokthonos hydrillicola Thurmond2011 TaxID=2712845 RepID=A0AAP5I5J3_9CYAN|nr:response regulator [Aetokthonos hydrillicola]MBO3459984.1 hybrid sensor histidine kinase/response regulator [Aetokthonos hydrillicola CCALA 1050]MBW4584581.1 hybrid sensor histidine kinase/response regulator [Aetokthonos hydrillicola CCALA 1050]MDR9895124.1 hybrid sensor histidine kinase/response regulator [Aetokthonos hydrillicola Thurmond2011]